MENKVVLQRIIKTSPEKLFRAFSDPVAYASWVPPYGFLCTVQKMDFKVGGTYAMTFTNFTTESSHSFGGEFVEIQPNEFLKITDVFDNPQLPGTMVTSVWFRKVVCGTEIKVEQSGIPSIIPIEMCYLGWQESLDKLTKLVEPSIQDA
jgi:uncharacterized protein YndB with AHSA1/START domain